jgi:predicted phosphodiesterase
MAFDVSRRWFIGGLASWGAFGGNRVFGALPGAFSGGTPKLKFGVISDVHIRVNPKGPGLASGYDTATLEHTLTWYRDQGVDAVAVVGDIADRGIVEEMEAFAATWFKVFPDDRAPDGRRVERIVVYGNHDWGGQHYRPFVLGKYKDESRFADHVLIAKPKEHWERIFHEPWEHVYRKDVKGYTFVGAQWSNGWCKGRDEVGIQGLDDFFATQKGRIDPSLPFFFFQHPHPKNTCYGSWAWGRDNGSATKNLSAYSNAVAFSGHSHYSLTDERSIWQGSFTSLGTSSLRYTGFTSRSLPQGFENASAAQKEKYDPYKVMKKFNTHDGRQGMLVSVYDDRIVFARREFVYDTSLGEDWVLPLPAAESKPFAFAEHAKKVGVPEFEVGAKLSVKKLKDKNRGYNRGKVKIPSVKKDIYEITFPAAKVVASARVMDYEISAVPNAGGEKVVRYVVPEGFNMSVSDRRVKQNVKCRIAVDQMPPEGTFRFEVRPRNSFGKTGAPITTA